MALSEQNSVEEAMMRDLKTIVNPFLFFDSEIRTAIDENGNPWFCAKDVCQALEITWSGVANTLENVPEKRVTAAFLETIKGLREMTLVDEAAIYTLAFRSTKPKAVAFSSWVVEEVLPQIRKHGFYGVIEPKDYVAIVKQMASLTKQIATTESVFERDLLLKPLRNLCNMAGHRMPDVKLLTNATNGTNKSNQSDLFGPEQ